MIVCPKIRPSGAPSTHAAKASRESAATLWTLCLPGRVSDNGLLRHRLTGAGGYEVSHRGVRPDGGAVVDLLAAQDRDLAAKAEVLGDRLAGVPALRDKQGDQDHVLSLDAIDYAPYLGVLVQKPDLVEVGPVADQHEGRAPGDLPSAHEVVRTLQDDVGHPIEGAQRSSVADGLPALPRDRPF